MANGKDKINDEEINQSIDDFFSNNEDNTYKEYSDNVSAKLIEDDFFNNLDFSDTNENIENLDFSDFNLDGLDWNYSEKIKERLINDCKSLELTKILYFNDANRFDVLKAKFTTLDLQLEELKLNINRENEELIPITNDNGSLIESTKKYIEQLIKYRKEIREDEDIEDIFLLCGNSIAILFLSILVFILYLLSPTRYLKQGLVYIVNKYKIPFAFKNKNDKKDEENNSNPQEDPRNKKKFSVGGIMFLLVKGVLMVLINGVYMPISTVDNALKLFGAGINKIFRGVTYIFGAKQTKEAVKQVRIFQTRRELGLKTNEMLITQNKVKSKIQQLRNKLIRLVSNVKPELGIKNNLRQSEIIKPSANNKNRLKEQRLRIKNKFFDAEKKLSRAISGKDIMNTPFIDKEKSLNKNNLEPKQQQQRIPNSEILNGLKNFTENLGTGFHRHQYGLMKDLMRERIKEHMQQVHEAREERRNERAIEQAISNYNNKKELSNTKQATNEVDLQTRARNAVENLFGNDFGVVSEVKLQEPMSPKIVEVKGVGKEKQNKISLEDTDIDNFLSNIENFHTESKKISQQPNINKPEIQLGEHQQKELDRKQQASINKNTGPSLY